MMAEGAMTCAVLLHLMGQEVRRSEQSGQEG